MKLRRVDPRTIKVPEERVTARMTEEQQAQFDASVKSLGIDEPIRVWAVGEELILSDGLHRLVSAINQGIERVDVLVKEGTERDVLFHNLRSGHLRGKHPVSEMRRQIERAYKEYQLGIEDIVRETGLTQAYVEQLLLINELTPLCLEALDQGRIGVGLAAALLKIKDPVQQEVALNLILTHHWGVKQLAEYIREVDALSQARPPAPSPGPPPPPQTVACHFCHDQFEPRELAVVAVCPGCGGVMYEAIALARRESQRLTDEAERQAPPGQGGAAPPKTGV